MSGAGERGPNPPVPAPVRFAPADKSLTPTFSFDLETRTSGFVVDGRDEAALPSPRVAQIPFVDPEDFTAPVGRGRGMGRGWGTPFGGTHVHQTTWIAMLEPPAMHAACVDMLGGGEGRALAWLGVQGRWGLRALP